VLQLPLTLALSEPAADCEYSPWQAEGPRHHVPTKQKSQENENLVGTKVTFCAYI
jgi:hypothetical protein